MNEEKNSEQAIFLSRRGWVIYLPLAIFPFLFSFVLLWIAQHSIKDMLVAFWIFVALYLFLLSILKTNYRLDKDRLTLTCSFLKKRIAISSIKKIKRGNHVWFAGWKYALSTKGLVVQYEDMREVLISPEEEERFLALVLLLNPEIQVIEA